jgi:hypothetical protein
MRKLSLILALAVTFALLVLVPPADTWKWQTHGGVYGTRGISRVAYDRIARDPAIGDNLEWDLIRSGTIKPDTWKGGPYYLEDRVEYPKHSMTYCENEGAKWLLSARDAVATENWDNVSYYLGIASHYWSQTTEYTQHDNAELYFENIDEDSGYDMWDALSEHLQQQVEHYRSQDPALIGSAEGTPYGSLEAFLADARDNLYAFRDATMDSDDWGNEDRFLWMWERTRKCENFGVQAGVGGQVDGYSLPGIKDCVDMATELIYSGWVYALTIQNDVSTRVISWDQWWSRAHRDLGVVFYPYGSGW